MGEATGVRPIGRDWTMLVDAAAALAVGVVFAGRGLPLAAQSGFVDLVRGGQPLRPAVFACLVLAVAVALPALLPALPGWPVALGGLLLTFLTDQALSGAAQLLPTSSPSSGRLLVALVAVAGTGVALGGALLAVGQASRPGRRLVAAGLAGGLVLHPVSTALAYVLLPVTESDGPRRDAQLWLPLVLTVAAAAVAWRRARVAGPAAAGRLRPGPLLVVGVAALLTLAGLTVRWWIVQQFRLSPDGLAGPRREQAVQAFGHFSAIVLAVVVGLVLLGYAYRIGRAVGARWVVLCLAAGPIALYGLPLSFTAAPGRACLVTAVGIAAVAAGAMLARHAPRLLPWDALGLLVAAVALPMAAPVVRAELPSVDTVRPLLTVLGLGLAFGFGLAHAATTSIGAASATASPSAPTASGPAWAVPTPAPAASDAAPAGSTPAPAAAAPAGVGAAPAGSTPAPAGVGAAPVGPGVAAMPAAASVARPDIGGRVALLALGLAAWVLSAQALAPVVTRSQFGGSYQGPAFTVPVFAGMAALLLAAFFGLGRAMDRLRQDLLGEPVPPRRP